VRTKPIWLLSAFALLVTVIASGGVRAAATNDVDTVWAAYAKRWAATATYTATFEQKIEIDGIGGEVDSGGRFYFSKPDRMRWDYTQGQEQRVVGDGSYIWVYQPDLQQVYRVDYQAAFGSGGLVALLAGRDGLAARYNLSLLESRPDVVRIRLSPKAEVGETLDLAMTADTFDLKSVVIKDPAGSVTYVHFDDVRRNVSLSESLFQFSPPAGVDVITSPAEGQ